VTLGKTCKVGWLNVGNTALVNVAGWNKSG
jgi:hypothetical protein